MDERHDYPVRDGARDGMQSASELVATAMERMMGGAPDDTRLTTLAAENIELKDTVYNLRLYLTVALKDLNRVGLCNTCKNRPRAYEDAPCSTCDRPSDRVASRPYQWDGEILFSGMPGYIPVDIPCERRVCFPDGSIKLI